MDFEGKMTPVEAEEKKSFREKFGDKVKKIKNLFESNKEDEVDSELNEVESELEDKMREYSPDTENDDDNKESEEARELRHGEKIFGLYEKFPRAIEGIRRKVKAFNNSAHICLENWGGKRGTEAAKEDCENALDVFNSWREKVLREGAGEVEEMKSEAEVKELPDNNTNERIKLGLNSIIENTEKLLEETSKVINAEDSIKSEETEELKETKEEAEK